MDKTSVCFWWDKVKDLDIPMPETVIVPFDKATQRAYNHLDEEHLIQKTMVDAIMPHIKEYPVFIRTDQSSAKHGWLRTCYVSSRKHLEQNLHNILEFNLCCDMMGLPATAFVIREYIEMENVFTAFHGMPVNPERRYFIRDGKVLCHHAYWIEGAIASASHNDKLPTDWKTILSRANHETDDEVLLLTWYANMLAERLEGFWSVDFCKAAHGEWYFIDVAAGEKSWHPEDCEFSK